VVLAAEEVLTICPGTWSSDFTLLVDGDVRIEGAGAAETRFDGEGRNPGPNILGSDRVTIYGVRITGTVRPDDVDAEGVPVTGVGPALNLAIPEAVLDGVVIDGNSATAAGGLAVGAGSTITIKNSTVAGNAASMGGGGAGLYYSSSDLVSEDTDWGAGTDDNAPDDIAFFDGPDGALAQSFSFEGLSSFVCDGSTRVCE